MVLYESRIFVKSRATNISIITCASLNLFLHFNFFLFSIFWWVSYFNHFNFAFYIQVKTGYVRHLAQAVRLLFR